MARPQSVSDDEIMGVARQVISRTGYDRFTLSEVAEQVGLSRAAIILRFQSTQALKIKLLADGIRQFLQSLEALPIRVGGDGLLDLADFLGGNLKVPENMAHHSSILRGAIPDPELASLEHQRRRAWHSAIMQRMPKTKIGMDEATFLFAAIVMGAITQWQMSPSISATDYLRRRIQDWLTLAGIEFTGC